MGPSGVFGLSSGVVASFSELAGALGLLVDEHAGAATSTRRRPEAKPKTSKPRDAKAMR
jgi:hypothetical protein